MGNGAGTDTTGKGSVTADSGIDTDSSTSLRTDTDNAGGAAVDTATSAYGNVVGVAGYLTTAHCVQLPLAPLRRDVDVLEAAAELVRVLDRKIEGGEGSAAWEWGEGEGELGDLMVLRMTVQRFADKF
jgi:hypothetical protein